MFKNWLEIYKSISSSGQKKDSLSCPNCQQKKIDFQFVGDPNTRIGYVSIWCILCYKGIHLSRVKAPSNVNLFSFDVSTDELAKRIPNFVQLTPLE